MSSPELEGDSDVQQSHNVPGSESTVALDPYLVDKFKANDPDNPHVSFDSLPFLGYPHTEGQTKNWSRARRWYLTLISSLLVLNA